MIHNSNTTVVQPILTSYTARQHNKKLIVIAVFMSVLAVMFLVLASISGRGYSPPAFDESASEGEPNPEENYMYYIGETEFGYKVGMATNMYQQKNQSMKGYLTNPKTNKVNLLFVVKDVDSGKELYRSGVIKPGEYIENLNPYSRFENKQFNVEINVCAFEPDNWKSKGTVKISNILHPW